VTTDVLTIADLAIGVSLLAETLKRQAQIRNGTDVRGLVQRT